MTTDSIKEWIAAGRKYADAIDKDRGFESGVTDCLRGLSDALEAMAGEVARLQSLVVETSAKAGAAIGSCEVLVEAIARKDEDVAVLTAERDRMKAALEKIVKAEYSGGAKTAIARKALGGDAS